MRHLLAVAALAVSLAPLPAAAQSGQVRNLTVEKGKVARLAVVTALTKECKVGEIGTIRIVNAPKSGQLNVRSGKAKTPAAFRCPNVETPVQGLFYQPRANFTGTDEVSYETRSSDGASETFTVKITVADKPGTGGSKGGAKDGVLDL